SPRRLNGASRQLWPRTCPVLCETTCNAYTRTTIALASRTICDILAKCIGILRRSCRGGEKTHPTRAARRPQRAASDGKASNNARGACCYHRGRGTKAVE